MLRVHKWHMKTKSLSVRKRDEIISICRISTNVIWFFLYFLILNAFIRYFYSLRMKMRRSSSIICFNTEKNYIQLIYIFNEFIMSGFLFLLQAMFSWVLTILLQPTHKEEAMRIRLGLANTRKRMPWILYLITILIAPTNRDKIIFMPEVIAKNHWHTFHICLQMHPYVCFR